MTSVHMSINTIEVQLENFFSNTFAFELFKLLYYSAQGLTKFGIWMDIDSGPNGVQSGVITHSRLSNSASKTPTV